MIWLMRLAAVLLVWLLLYWALTTLANALERNGRSRRLVLIPAVAILVLILDRMTGQPPRSS